MFSPALSNNPFRSRSDLSGALLELWRPIRPLLERDGAAIRLGANQAAYGEPDAMLEAFARPLWGLAPLAAGGIEFADWPLIRRALVEGVDPAHPRYWGKGADYGQCFVEMAAVATGMLLAPHELWEPLARGERKHLVDWLSVINRRTVVPNNWLFFRVLVNLALEQVGAPFDGAQALGDLDFIDELYLGNGWYEDGLNGNRDYYVPMAFHFYGLLYSVCRRGKDPARAERLLERARLLAPQFAAWFASDGSCVPFGRSLTYRFAQGCFWGACAFAGEEVLPWGMIKGLYLRHLRSWMSKPIFSETGLLTVGYGYPNLIAADFYNSPASPYWAFKSFLPLALTEDHPFWQAEEEPWEGPEVSAQPEVPLLVGRDRSRNHVFALSGHGSGSWDPRFAKEKYTKLAYSNVFGFGVPVGGSSPKCGGADNALLLTDDGHDWRSRSAIVESRMEGNFVYSRWLPWPDVEVESWQILALPGHLRAHRIRTGRGLRSFEGGFPLDRLRQNAGLGETAERVAVLNYAAGFSGLVDLGGRRRGEICAPQPNTNLLWPLVSLPGLNGRHEPGDIWLFTAVVGLPGPGHSLAGKGFLEEFSVETGDVPRIFRNGELLCACGSDRVPLSSRSGAADGYPAIV